ncbi:MAG: mechanosensitive ion channel family protein [Candidatus Nanoarchaeia archaeon]
MFLNLTNVHNKDYILRLIKRGLIIILAITLFQIVDLIGIYFYIDAVLKLTLLYVIIQNAIRIISRTSIFLYMRAKNLPLDSQDLFIVGLSHIFMILKYIFLFTAGLYLFGIEIETFFTSISIVGVAIAILFKEFISNMLSGMYLFFSEHINLKHYVEINGIRGNVKDISFQAIELITDSGNHVYIPNSTIQTKEIINFSKESLKQINIEVVLLRDEMPLIKRIEKEVQKKLNKEYEQLLSKKAEEPIQLEYREISSKDVTFAFIITTSKFSFDIEYDIKQFTYKVIGDLLIKYHETEKSRAIEKEEGELK